MLCGERSTWRRTWVLAEFRVLRRRRESGREKKQNFANLLSHLTSVMGETHAEQDVGNAAAAEIHQPGA